MKANLVKEKYLLFKARNKDPQAFTQVYDLYVEKIYRFIYFKVSSQEQAQDLTSEVFLKTWQYIIDGKEIKNLKALFYTIARNLIIDHYRRASQKEVSIERDILEQQSEPFVSDEINRLESLLNIEKIELKLKELKDEYREVLVLRYIEELSIKEMAEVLQKNSGNVRVLLYRAINALKNLMEEKDLQ